MGDSLDLDAWWDEPAYQAARGSTERGDQRGDRMGSV